MSSVKIEGDTAHVADGTTWKMDAYGQVEIRNRDQLITVQKADIAEIVYFLGAAVMRAKMAP